MGVDMFSWKRRFQWRGLHTVEQSLSVMREWYSFEIDGPHVICVSMNKMRHLRDMLEGTYDE